MNTCAKKQGQFYSVTFYVSVINVYVSQLKFAIKYKLVIARLGPVQKNSWGLGIVFKHLHTYPMFFEREYRIKYIL